MRLSYKGRKVQVKFTASEEQRRFGWIQDWFDQHKLKAFGAMRNVVAAIDQVESMIGSAPVRLWWNDAVMVRVRVRTNPKEAGTGSILTSENMGF